MLATGYADIMLDPVMNPLDIMAAVPVIRGAGGTITDFAGNDPVSGMRVFRSAAHYGLPELQGPPTPNAPLVANPGCYATGAIALIRPLVDAGLIPADFPLALPSVSGYSGGGRTMIEAYEAGTAPLFEAYALGLAHKHIPEIMALTGLTRRPLFIPAVGNFRQGMLVQLPLHLDELPGRPRAADLHDALAAHYAASEAGGGFVRVLPPTEDGKLDATALNDTNRLELRVFANEAHRHAVLIARLDNLGKGASGAAVQNLRLMLGL